MTESPHETGCSDLHALAVRVHRDYEVWYAKSVRRVGFSCMALQGITMLTGFATACLAALTSPNEFGGWTKASMVLLPAIGSLAAGLVVQLRLHDLWRLREDGRISFQDLALQVEGLARSVGTDDDLKQAFEMIRLRILGIETDQSRRFFGLAPAVPVHYRPAPAPPADGG